jgi:hypothetical protein
MAAFSKNEMTADQSRRTGRTLACALALAVCLAARRTAFAQPQPPPGAQPGDNAVLLWDEAALQAIRDTKPGPTVVARALAIVHTAIYDAWAAYDAVAVPTMAHGPWRRPSGEATDVRKSRALSFAAYRALLDLFPTEKNLFDGVMGYLGYDPTDTTTDPASPSGIGNLAAASVLAFRHHDGSNQLGDLHPGPYSDYTGYVAVNSPQVVVDPNRWQPLDVLGPQGTLVTQTYTTPHWGLVIPFAIPAGSAMRPGPPARYPSIEYRSQADELIAISANLKDEQKVTAEYFADGPSSEFPPGHWALFAQAVSRRDHHTIDQDARLFFALGNALMDAGICVWDAKRAYDSERPGTAIHFLYAGQQIRAWGGPFQGTQTMDGSNWRPYQLASVVTPPFPEFCSGHSAFSAAGAEILKSFTESDDFGASVVIHAGTSRGEPGLVPATDVTLSWPTFSAAADQAGMSRRYGGIHFAQGDLTARALGRRVGAAVWARALTYFDGTAESRPNPLLRQGFAAEPRVVLPR